jgi:hypothetical protein
MVEKTEGAIKNVQSRDTGNIGRTRHMTNTSKTTNNNKTHATWKTREMNNIDLITYRWWAQVLRKAKQSLSLIRHPTCYSHEKDMLDTNIRSRRVRDRMVVGFKTTYAISAYHHWWCEFESRSGRGVQHYVITFVSDATGMWFSPDPSVSSTNTTERYDMTEILLKIKHHQT